MFSTNDDDAFEGWYDKLEDVARDNGSAIFGFDASTGSEVWLPPLPPASETPEWNILSKKLMRGLRSDASELVLERLGKFGEVAD